MAPQALDRHQLDGQVYNGRSAVSEGKKDSSVQCMLACLADTGVLSGSMERDVRWPRERFILAFHPWHFQTNTPLLSLFSARYLFRQINMK